MNYKAIFNIAPVPASRPRVTRWSTFYPKKYTAFRQELGVLLDSYCLTPSQDLLYVKLDFHVQIPKSWSKKKKAEKDTRFCDNNMDVDNLCKAVLDSCEGHYYENDKQIVMIRARKFWSLDGRIEYEQSPIQDIA